MHIMRKYSLSITSASIIQSFVNICLLNAKERRGGVDGLVKWKSKSMGTAVLALRSLRKSAEFSIVNHDRRTTPTCALRPTVVQGWDANAMSHLPSFPCSTDLSLREIMRDWADRERRVRDLSRVDKRVTIHFYANTFARRDSIAHKNG